MLYLRLCVCPILALLASAPAFAKTETLAERGKRMCDEAGIAPEDCTILPPALRTADGDATRLGGADAGPLGLRPEPRPANGFGVRPLGFAIGMDDSIGSDLGNDDDSNIGSSLGGAGIGGGSDNGDGGEDNGVGDNGDGNVDNGDSGDTGKYDRDRKHHKDKHHHDKKHGKGKRGHDKKHGKGKHGHDKKHGKGKHGHDKGHGKGKHGHDKGHGKGKHGHDKGKNHR
ncbi:MAG: hypothetical protein ACR2QJ_15430 [Geminicoccaceae bacterium]